MTRHALLATLLLAACADGEHAAPTPDTPAIAGGPAAALTSSVLLGGLDNPRGLAFGPEGALYVVETGRPEVNGPCVTIPRGQNCYSGTGAVTRWWKGRRERIASGLPSFYNPAANDVGGPNDIAFLGRGNAVVTIGWGTDPALRAGFGAYARGFASLVQLTPNGAWRLLADLGALETAANPAGGPLDTNPFGVLNEPGRRWVADAGGNDLIEILADGETRAVALFPTVPAPPPFGQSEPVPTEVERGPDGALYVSTLSGVPFVAGNARIYRVVPGTAPTVVADGFKMITDFAFAPDGGMYVVEFDTAPLFFGGPGRLTHVAPDGARTVLSTALVAPTGVAVGPDGAIYVSNKGNQAGTGEVLRFVP